MIIMLWSSQTRFLIKLCFSKCQGQITRAQEQEEIYALKRDLVVLRRRDEATTAALLEANRRIEELTMFKVFNLCGFSFIKVTLSFEQVDQFMSVVLGTVGLP